MRTNTGAALRAVEEIDDPLEVATREVRQVEAEKAEVKAKLEELRVALAEVDAVVSSGDHRKIDDDLLERGARCQRGIAAMEKALEVVEARRIEASEHGSRIRRARSEVAAAAAVAEHDAKIGPATQALEEAAEALLKACDTRVHVIEAAGSAHASASAYGIPAGAQAESTREVLARVQRKTGIRIELGPPGPIGVLR